MYQFENSKEIKSINKKVDKINQIKFFIKRFDNLEDNQRKINKTLNKQLLCWYVLIIFSSGVTSDTFFFITVMVLNFILGRSYFQERSLNKSKKFCTNGLKELGITYTGGKFLFLDSTDELIKVSSLVENLSLQKMEKIGNWC